jgi:BlaI family penicillinase repressor
MENLPDAELEVLSCLQRQGQATARQIRELMHGYRPMAHASVLTLLTRLEAKGLVCRQKGDFGKAFIYLPTNRSKATPGRALKRILHRVFHGDGVALVSSLFQSKPPSPEELDKLGQLLRDLRAKRTEKPTGHEPRD